MNPETTPAALNPARPASTVIEASGQTDDIRYVLNRTNPDPAASPSDANPAGEAGLPAQANDRLVAAGGVSDMVIDDADDQLADRTASTIRGGQVGKESKRGAY